MNESTTNYTNYDKQRRNYNTGQQTAVFRPVESRQRNYN